MTLEKALQIITTQAESIHDLQKKYEESERYRNMWLEKTLKLENELRTQGVSSTVEELEGKGKTVESKTELSMSFKECF